MPSVSAFPFSLGSPTGPSQGYPAQGALARSMLLLLSLLPMDTE
ncbi:hypothetical protein [Cohnella boryungensis]|uniref:Uncharacterized protein n=1 Tax=Cohnella boryungensis TaxID=768479 RepID=A0ABV8SD77_9BACL